MDFIIHLHFNVYKKNMLRYYAKNERKVSFDFCIIPTKILLKFKYIPSLKIVSLGCANI